MPPRRSTYRTALNSRFKAARLRRAGVEPVKGAPGVASQQASDRWVEGKLVRVIWDQPASVGGRWSTAGRELVIPMIDAAINMERSILALGPALESLPEAVTPQVARSAAATEQMWRALEAEFGLLSSTEVSVAVGSKTPNRSYASEQRAAGKLLAVKRLGGLRYPGFQIDTAEKTVRPVMAELIKAAKAAGRSEASLALWMMIPSGYLDGARPVDKLDRPGDVAQAAHKSFNVEW